MRGYTGRVLACFIAILAFSALVTFGPVAALCLTLITNAAMLWRTRAVHHLDEAVTHRPPAHPKRFNRDLGYHLVGVEPEFVARGHRRVRLPNSFQV